MTIQGQDIRAASTDIEAAPLPLAIGFLSRHGIDTRVLRQAAATAAATGVTADEAAIKCDLVDEITFYRALAHELGAPFLAEVQVGGEARYPESVLAGVAPLAPSLGRTRFALAPRGEALARLLARRRMFGPGLVITTPSALLRGVLRAHPRAIAWHAANNLPHTRPDWSYRGSSSVRQIAWAAALGGFVLVCAILAPKATLALIMALSGLVFLTMVTLRLAAIFERIPVEPARPPRRWDDRNLPVYTLIVALYRERRVLSRLVQALAALDYPAPKLDIKLVIEAEDEEMRQALGAMRLPARFEVIVAPPGLPRTKPRALNVALPLARGEFITVYDAEDVPSPDQLRLAVATFARLPPDVACLQARLVIDNTEDSWLTRFFTIEYATLFDVINPGLATFDLPVPLGGTSNHFRRRILQGLHGWDAWNVTEDADLGMRLALAGYRVADLPSSTLEEAPAEGRAWMRQRTRWMKGYTQVCITHSRRPWLALRSLGPLRFFGAVAVTLGTIAAALSFPFFTAFYLASLVDGRLLAADTAFGVVSLGFGFILFPAGLLAIIAPAVAALVRRRWWHLLPYVPLLPLYYVLISIAAWRGVAEVISDPYRWNKTEHGLARTSRSGVLTSSGAAPEPPAPGGGRG